MIFLDISIFSICTTSSLISSKSFSNNSESIVPETEKSVIIPVDSTESTFRDRDKLTNFFNSTNAPLLNSKGVVILTISPSFKIEDDVFTPINELSVINCTSSTSICSTDIFFTLGPFIDVIIGLNPTPPSSLLKIIVSNIL